MHSITVAIPSVNGGPLLMACLGSLARQTDSDFQVIVIDNSGTGAIERDFMGGEWNFTLAVFRADRNLGFAAAVNTVWKQWPAPLLATLNDDAEAHPEWLASLRRAVESGDDVGMCASQVRLYGTDRLDSAGMLICRDGSSKQRGQGEPAGDYAVAQDVLFPSASAALYRRAMLEDIGWFDEDFFLYCEDTDLGLRARWGGWRCVYAPEAVVEHHYSKSAGAASALKAAQIERNRLWVAAKNFPPAMLLQIPLWAALRYGWQAWFLLRGRGSVAQFRQQGSSVWEMAAIVWRAHVSLITNFGALRRKRNAIRKTALLNSRQYAKLLKRHLISPREIARL